MSEPIKERLPKPPPAFPDVKQGDRPPEPPPSRPRNETEEFYPKYVQLPSWRQRGSGPRNLGWGVALVLLGVALLGVGLHYAGPRVMIPVGVSFATATLLFVVARARVFRQRNGSFLAAALVFVLGTVLALAEYGWTLLGKPSQADTPATVASVQPAPVAVTATPVQNNSTPETAPSLVDAFHLQPPAPDAQRVKVLKESRVPIDNKTYLIRAGDEFALAGMGNGEVRFQAGEQQISLPSDMVEVSGPSGAAAAQPGAAAGSPNKAAKAPETPVSLTERAQREAVRRYPAIGIKDSPENQLFIETVQGLRNSGATDFFERPDWPLRLAESLAQKEGWKREDAAAPPQPEQPAQPAEPAQPAAGEPTAPQEAALPEQ